MSPCPYWLQVMGQCRGWLADMLVRASVALELADANESAAVLMQCSLRYACDTMDAITSELLARRPLQAAVLVRTMFELALRVRWVTLYDHGWARLVAYWVVEHKKSLGKVDHGHLDAEATERVKQSCEDYGTFLKDVACPQPAHFNEVLGQVVEKVDGRKNPEWSGLLYNGYRDLCRYAHANMTVCAGGIPISEIGRVVLVNVAYATVQFLEASRAAFGVTLSEEQLDELYGLVGLAGQSEWESEG